MNQRCYALSACLLCLPALAFAQSSQSSNGGPRVVVISLDGFPAYDLEDPKLPIPTLRQLMAAGSWARRMQPVNPTVTWPNHTTMVTGLYPRDHGLLYNGTLVRTDSPFGVKVDPAIDKTRMVHAPTVYDVAFEKGLTTAQVDWVAINNAPTITWAFPERAKPSDPLPAEMIRKGLLQADDLGNSSKPVILWRDQVWTKAGVYLLTERRPNLLLVHLLSLDTTHHSYGPRTLASYDAIAFLDGCVRQLIDATRAANTFSQTTFIVVSDHGFQAVTQQIHLQALLAKAQWTAGVQAVPEGGSAMLYIEHGREADLLPKLRTLFTGTEGIASVADPGSYASLGLPAPDRDPQAPALVAFAQPGYAFSGGKESDPLLTPVSPPTGSHGYLNTDAEMDAIFIAAGNGIRKGVVLDRITNRRVAPTLARLLGVQLPRTEDSALTEILP